MYPRNISFIFFLAIQIFTIESKPPQRLLNSVEAQPAEIKYQVSIQRKKEHVCGGALISEFHVLTAAHCFVGSMNPPYTEGIIILTGTTSLISGGERHKAKYVTVHPDYVKGNSANRWQHDIAIITLLTPAKRNEFQAPVDIPLNDARTSVSATLSGWGKMSKDANGIFPDNLQKSTVTTLTQADCNTTTLIYDTHLCAYDGVNTGFCYGDSGSPLVYKNEVIGIVSFSRSCGFGYPDVYTRVWSYRDFIADAMTRS